MDVEQRARELLAQALRIDVEFLKKYGDMPNMISYSSALPAIVAALTPPEGYVLVPVQPTEAMLNEGYGWVDGTGLELAYMSMLAARPEVPDGRG